MNKALVEASSGSMGALFACLVLFPLDVAKTKRQADTETTTKKGSTLELLRSIWKDEGVDGLFSGLGPKAAHTILSNFFYFYWYAWLKSAYEKSRGPLTTSATLAIGAAAGAINMTITLPLEVISTRIQTASKDEAASSQSSLELLRSMYHEHGIVSLWKGYLPSLVLVSNPSIFYTIFDRLKLYVARELSAMEAFVLAAVAKSIATVVTYPVIRAKVLMQAAENAKNKENASLSMVQVLDRTWRDGGAAALFQGCNAQLVNTVFKSALLLMTKEQIAAVTIRLLYPFQQKA